MFLEKYLNEFYLEQVYDNYDYGYLNSLDEDNFALIYGLFKYYKFYFIEDIILKYLEIFEMDFNDVKRGIDKLKDMLGDNFVYIIGNDMRYLDEILECDIKD